MGHLLTENRHGLMRTGAGDPGDRATAERDAALAMLSELPDTGRITLGGDKNYDTEAFVL